MVDSVRVQVDGLKLVTKNLRAVDRELPKELSKIHRQVAEPVADKGRSRVRSRTGRLAASVKAGGSQRAATVTAGARLRPYPYAPINHYGGYPGDYGGNPFLTEAFTEEHQSSISLYDQLLHEFVEKVWVDG